MLKPLLPFITSSEKIGYVEGRHILDGILHFHEVIHSLKYTKTLGMLLKLDLSKAFHHLNWEYIENILLAFGFSQDWVRWILSLLSSTFFLFLVNESPSPTFLPSYRIQQGDPLSPFLFILMVEGLSRMLNNATTNGSLKGLKLHNSKPLAHQQFVDDYLQLSHPSIQESCTLKLLLNSFSGGLRHHYKFGQIPHVLLQHNPPDSKIHLLNLGFCFLLSPLQIPRSFANCLINKALQLEGNHRKINSTDLLIEFQNSQSCRAPHSPKIYSLDNVVVSLLCSRYPQMGAQIHSENTTHLSLERGK
jgi:hypothetical protein